jgi:DNA polymerase epsilon subunit 2
VLLQVFRKYSNALGPDAISFVEDILTEHEIAEEDFESSIETLAREYNKQDGEFYVGYFCNE